MLGGWLPRQLEANYDLTLQEHREAFEEGFGEEVSTSTVGRAIAREFRRDRGSLLRRGRAPTLAGAAALHLPEDG
jgi:hypothetical protein